MRPFSYYHRDALSQLEMKTVHERRYRLYARVCITHTYTRIGKVKHVFVFIIEQDREKE